MNNNDIFKKLRVALFLKDIDIIEILKREDFEIKSSELSAFFRNEDHPNFRKCGDQLLRKFLDGLIKRNRELGVEKLGEFNKEKNLVRVSNLNKEKSENDVQDRSVSSYPKSLFKPKSNLPKVNSKNKSVMRERRNKSENE